MSFQFYTYIQIVVSATLLFIGQSLIFGNIPKELKKGSYDISRKIMGLAISILPIMSIIFVGFDMLNKPHVYSEALHISGYHIISILLCLSLVILMKNKSEIRIFLVKIALITGITLPAVLWTALIMCDESMADMIIIIGNTLLFASIVCLTVMFFVGYKSAFEQTETIYPDNAHKRIHWVRNVSYMFIGLGAVACIAPTFLEYPMWLGLLYMSYGLGVFIYVYSRYQRIMLIFIEVSQTVIPQNLDTNLVPEIKDINTKLNSETTQHIQEHIDKWVAKKLYTKNGLTINSVSSYIGSNRTYLSSYINFTYNCSFKVWVTRLRLNEAKHMLEKTEYNLNQISQKVGFSSTNSFIHVFTKSEGVSPTRYRTQHTNQKQE